MRFIIGVILLITTCQSTPNDRAFTLPYYNTADFTPHWYQSQDSIDACHRVGPFNFTDQLGDTITQATFGGHIQVANFFFTACGSVCPKMTNNLIQIQKAYPGDSNIKLASFSVTPYQDSTEVLKRYADNYEINANQWHLLTGNLSELYRLGRQSYFVEEEPGFSRDSTSFLHTEHILLIDRNGHIRGIYNGTVLLETTRLIDHIGILLKEDELLND